MMAFGLMFSQAAHAGGGVGGGGGGGGGSGGAQSRYGYGWYVFNTDGSGTGTPASMRDGSRWSNVQDICRSENAAQIVAFIVQTPRQSVNSSVVYKYSTSFGGSRYLGNSGGNWEPIPVAQAQFNTLPAYGVDTTGYTFGGSNGNVAWFCYDFQPQGWDISVAVSVDRATALPGTQINWTHSVRNNGPAAASGVRYGSNTGPNQFGPTGIASGGTSANSTSYVVTQADVGTSVCRSTVASPRSSADGSSIGTGNACVTVPYSYTLTPTVTVNRTSGGVGAPVIVQPAVTNSGPTKSQPADWQVARFIIKPGVAIPAGAVSALTPCAYVKTQVVADCTENLNGASASGAVFGLGVSTLTGTNDTLTDLAVGSHVCYILSVKPNANDNPNYRHSQPACVVISKSPSIQVLGGDLRVGAAFTGNSPVASSIRTSVTIKTDKSYGSWGEYGLIAPGTITGTGSGSSYSGGITCIDSCATNSLSFANTPSVGGFISTTKIPNVAASFPVTNATPTFLNLSDAAQKRVETGTGTITISGGVIAQGQWLVINAPNATVTITGDITYANGSLGAITDIPQLIIIADQINIENNVKNVDAWLIASGPTGTIVTCSKSGATNVTTVTQLTTNLCQNPLVINGPVMARKLYLLRTAGSDQAAASGNPAEVINLRPDAFLWGIAHNSNSGRLTTVYETELPPRF